MLVVVAIVVAYLALSIFAAFYLVGRCSTITADNKRRLAKSFIVALFFTPTISVPGTVPVPALAMLSMGIVGIIQLRVEYLAIALLYGLLPIVVSTILILSVARPSKKQ